MNRRSKITFTSLTALSLAALSGLACSSGDSGGPSACDGLTNYKATTMGPVSFATDIYPILSDTSTPSGCGQTAICHGNPPGGLDDVFSPTKFMQFAYDPPDIAMAKAQLMMPSVNAPSMMRVVPGSVGTSFLSYKIAGEQTTLACVSSMCVSGASVGSHMPCGDLMPSIGAALSAANRTKILDWIALGAAN